MLKLLEYHIVLLLFLAIVSFFFLVRVGSVGAHLNHQRDDSDEYPQCLLLFFHRDMVMNY